MRYIKYLSFLFLFLTQSLIGQEVSLAIPFAEGLYPDLGIQVNEISDGFIILGLRICPSDSSGGVTNCLGLMRLDRDFNVTWSKVIDGGEGSSLSPNGLTMVIHSDTIYIANNLEIDSIQQLRLLAFDMQGEVLINKDQPIEAHKFFLYEMIEANDHLFVFGKLNTIDTSYIFIRKFDYQFNLLKAANLEAANVTKRGIDIIKNKDEGFTLAYGEAWVFDQVTMAMAHISDDLEVSNKKIIIDPESSDPFISPEIEQANDGGFYMTWQKDLSHIWFDTLPYPTAVYKMDAEYNIDWELVFAGEWIEEHISTSILENGNLLGVGGTNYYGSNDIYERGFDGWCFLVNEIGDLIWEKSIADIRDTGSGRLFHGIEIPSGFLFTGDLSKDNPTNEPFSNNTEVWVVTLDENGCWNSNCNEFLVITGDTSSISSVEEINVDDYIDIHVFPNPTAGVLTIEWQEYQPGQNQSVQIYAANGQLVNTFMSLAKKTILNMNHLANGLYVVKIIENGKVRGVEKVVVQR